jgi:hypothetical protein
VSARDEPSAALERDGAGSGDFHLCGSNSWILLSGWVWTRVSTSVRYATGFTPFFSQDATSV